jgi:import inner membrane translocase subunit TIM21
VNSLEIIKAGEPRAFSTTSGALSPPDDKGKKTGSSKALSRQEGRGDGQVTLSVGEKVKEDAKTATYGGVILLGIAVTCAMGYFILSELFSDDSPNNIYTKSFKLCKANQDVQDTLGGPIKCYGEETRRGWRRHVAHQQFLHGETKILRMRFYLEGKFNKATVHVEKKGNVNGKYDYSYLVVDVDGYPPRRITIDT